MTNVFKLPIFALMDVLFWDNSGNGYKKEKDGKYEPESKKHQKQGQSQGQSEVGHKKSASSKNLEENEEDEENMTNRGQGHQGNKQNRGY